MPLDKFLQMYSIVRQEGWEEKTGNGGQPFQMVHEQYDGVYSVEEAYNLCQYEIAQTMGMGMVN